MNTRIKFAAAAVAASLGLAASPVLAQTYDTPAASGIHEDGSLNVFGAHIDPPGVRSGGVLGGDTRDMQTTGSLGRRGLDGDGPVSGGYSRGLGY